MWRCPRRHSLTRHSPSLLHCTCLSYQPLQLTDYIATSCRRRLAVTSCSYCTHDVSLTNGRGRLTGVGHMTWGFLTGWISKLEASDRCAFDRGGIWLYAAVYTSCLKKDHFYFYDDFGKSWLIFIFFTVFIYDPEAAGIKTTTSPQICCRTTLQKVSIQLCSFTKQLIQFKMMKRRLITLNCHEGCYFFVCIRRLIYHMQVFELRTPWLTDASMHCSMLFQTFIVITQARA